MSDRMKVIEDIIVMGMKIASKGALNEEDGNAIAKLVVAYNAAPKPEPLPVARLLPKKK